MGNPFCHVELHSNDPEASKKFYGDLLNWEFEDMPMDNSTYTMIKVGEGTGGGLIQNQAPPGTPPHWLSYILVEDIKATTEKARGLGATILQDVMPVADYGAFTVIQDPSGAVVAFWQDKSKS